MWKVYEQEESDAEWKKFTEVETKEHAVSQVGASCTIHLWGGNHAVKIEDGNGESEIFLCDEINEKQRLKQKKEAEEAKNKAVDNEVEKIKLW